MVQLHFPLPWYRQSAVLPPPRKNIWRRRCLDQAASISSLLPVAPGALSSLSRGVCSTERRHYRQPRRVTQPHCPFRVRCFWPTPSTNHHPTSPQPADRKDWRRPGCVLGGLVVTLGGGRSRHWLHRQITGRESGRTCNAAGRAASAAAGELYAPVSIAARRRWCLPRDRAVRRCRRRRRPPTADVDPTLFITPTCI